MPPHCDSLDGPVVTAATRALEAGDVELVLPFVHEEGEAEVAKAFEQALAVRKQGPEARELADLHFFETVVRIHRAGEGAPYTGLKPAGLGHGPVVPVAEEAIETGSPRKLASLLADKVRAEVEERFGHMMELRARADGDVAATRRYVEAMLGLEIWAKRLYEAAEATPHGEHGHAH